MGLVSPIIAPTLESKWPLERFWGFGDALPPTHPFPAFRPRPPLLIQPSLFKGLPTATGLLFFGEFAGGGDLGGFGVVTLYAKNLAILHMKDSGISSRVPHVADFDDMIYAESGL